MKAVFLGKDKDAVAAALLHLVERGVEVAAGAVVVEDISAGAVVAGVPARAMKRGG